MTKINSKYKRLLKPFKNVFLLILVGFFVWMLFFDSNSWFIHNELNNDIDKSNTNKICRLVSTRNPNQIYRNSLGDKYSIEKVKDLYYQFLLEKQFENL